MLRQAGIEFYDPDAAARSFLSSGLGMNQQDANAAAWQQGRRLLERAIDEGKEFVFETTLGGNTIASLLKKAITQRIEVRIWYVGSKARSCTSLACVHALNSETRHF